MITLLRVKQQAKRYVAIVVVPVRVLMALFLAARPLVIVILVVVLAQGQENPRLIRISVAAVTTIKPA